MLRPNARPTRFRMKSPTPCARSSRQDAAETAKLIAKGTPVARINTGIDGGMNKVFAARVPDGNTGLSEGGDGQGLSLLSMSRAPGTIPSHVNPPRAPSDNLLLGAPEEPKIAAVPRHADRRTDAGRQCGAERAVRRLLLQPRPQGRPRRQLPTPPRARRRRAKPKVIEAKRTEPPRAEAAVPKTRPPATEAGRGQAAAETVRVRRAGRSACARRQEQSGGRVGTDHVVELVRQPLWGDEVSILRESFSWLSSLAKAG